MTATRQALAIALPAAIALAIPALVLVLADDAHVGCGLTGALALVPVLAGSLLVAAGLLLWAWTVRLFAQVGKGTLAPWDPPTNLVARGPYRHVRNPMIAGVLAVLAGEALLFGSLALLAWCLAFFAVNHAFLIAHEEPVLERRFGDGYREYRHTVPRWIPRKRL